MYVWQWHSCHTQFVWKWKNFYRLQWHSRHTQFACKRKLSRTTMAFSPYTICLRMKRNHASVHVAPVSQRFEPWWPWELHLLKFFIIIIIIQLNTMATLSNIVKRSPNNITKPVSEFWLKITSSGALSDKGKSEKNWIYTAEQSDPIWLFPWNSSLFSQLCYPRPVKTYPLFRKTARNLSEVSTASQNYSWQVLTVGTEMTLSGGVKSSDPPPRLPPTQILFQHTKKVGLVSGISCPGYGGVGYFGMIFSGTTDSET